MRPRCLFLRWISLVLAMVAALVFSGAPGASAQTADGDVAAFCRTHLGTLETGNIPRILEDYAPSVTWHKDGVVTQDFIRQDKGKYYADWPTVRYDFDGPLRIHRDGDLVEVTFRSVYAAANASPKKPVSAGRAENVWKLQRVGTSWQVVFEDQKITAHNLPPALVAQMFAQPAGGAPSAGVPAAAAPAAAPRGTAAALPGDLVAAIAQYHEMWTPGQTDTGKILNAGSAARKAQQMAEALLARDGNNYRLLTAAAEAAVFSRDVAKADEYASRAALLLVDVPPREQDIEAEALSVWALVNAQQGPNTPPPILDRVEKLAAAAMKLLRQPGVPHDTPAAKHARDTIEAAVDSLSGRNAGRFTLQIVEQPTLELLTRQANTQRAALRVLALVPNPAGWSEAVAVKSLATLDHSLGLYFQTPGAWEEGTRLMARLPELPRQPFDFLNFSDLAIKYAPVYARLGHFSGIEKLAALGESEAKAALARGAQPFVADDIRARHAGLRLIYGTRDDPRAVEGGGLLPASDQPLPARLDGQGYKVFGAGELSVVFNPDANLDLHGADGYNWQSGPVVSRSNRLMAIPKQYAQNRHALGGNCVVYDLQANLAMGTVTLPKDGAKDADYSDQLRLAFSPDDRYLILGYPGRVHVCDLNTGELVYSLALPGIQAVAVDAASRQLVCATLGSVYRCDLPTGKNLVRSNLPRGVDDVRLSADGGHLTAWTRTGSEQVACDSWELASGQVSAHFICPIPRESAQHIAFLGAERITSLQMDAPPPAKAAAKPAPVGAFVLAKWRVRQWDARDGHLLLDQLTGEALPGRPPGGSAFDLPATWNVSPSGRWLARQKNSAPELGGKTAATMYFDLAAGARGPLTALDRDEGFGRHFTPDEQFTIGIKGDDLVVGDFQRGLFARSLQPAGRLGASGLAFNRGGTRLAVSYDDGSLRIFDLPHGRLERNITPADSSLQRGDFTRFYYSHPEFSPDDRHVLVCRETFGRHSTTDFTVYRTTTGTAILTLRSDNVPRFSPNGRYLILCGAGTDLYTKSDPITIESPDTLRIFDLDAGGRCVGWFNGQTCGDVSADGSLVASIGRDKQLHVWELASGRQVAAAPLSDAAASGQLAIPGADHRFVIMRQDGLEAWTHDVSGLRQVYSQGTPAADGLRTVQGWRFDPTGRFAAVHRRKNGTTPTNDKGPDGEFLDLWSLERGQLLTTIQQPLLGELSYGFDEAGRLALRTVAQATPGAPVGESIDVYQASDGKKLAGYALRPDTLEKQLIQAGGLAIGGGRIARLEGGSDYVSAVSVADLLTGNRLASVHSFFPDGDAIIAPDNTYTASKNILQRLGARVGNRIFPFEQFDLRLNRPDLLAARLGGDKASVASLEAAYRKRLTRMGLKEEMLRDDWHLPEVSIDRHALPQIAPGEKLPVHVTARDSRYGLDHLQCFVNDVPVFGSEGMKITDRARTEPGVAYDATVSVPLAAGSNKVQVSAFNVRGVESLRETFTVARGNGDGPARPRLFLVTIGVKSYPGKDPAGNSMALQFPVDDARDVAEFFQRTSGKDYAEVKTLPLLEGDAVREKILAAREFLLASKVDDTAVVYVAGHGLLDEATRDYYFAPIDMDFAAPAKRGVSYEQLEGLLDGIPALRKLLVLDTCAAGEPDADDAPPTLLGSRPASATVAAAATPGVPRGRGVAGVRPLERKGIADARLLEAFADLRRGSGAMVIAAAGAQETAGEDGGHGFFTGSLLEGLRSGRADLNGDGRITVTELREDAARQVRKRTDGVQQPVLRRENLEMDFLVCTVPPRLADGKRLAGTAGNSSVEQAMPFLKGLVEAYLQALARGDVEQAQAFFPEGKVVYEGAPLSRALLRARLAKASDPWKGCRVELAGEPAVRADRFANRNGVTDSEVGDDTVELAVQFKVTPANTVSRPESREEKMEFQLTAAPWKKSETYSLRHWRITAVKSASSSR